MSSWREVRRDRNCPICGKSHWCSYSTDGNYVVCRRIGGKDAIYRIDRSGVGYWLYCINREMDTEEPPLIEKTQVEKVGQGLLNEVYSALLVLCPLTDHHAKNLQNRGLKSSEIERRAYGTLTIYDRIQIANKLVDRFGDDTCRKVPGIIIKQGSYKNYWSLAGSPGLLIPVRDIQKRIIALKIRLDDSDERGKYRSFSSTAYNGPGPGAQIHVPLFDGNIGETVRVTEGELKADIATVYDNTLTLSIPGVAAWRQSIEILNELKVKKIKIAFDKDAEQNLSVANCMMDFYRELKKNNFIISIERW